MCCKTNYKFLVYVELLLGKDSGGVDFIYLFKGINIMQITLVTAGPQSCNMFSITFWVSWRWSGVDNTDFQWDRRFIIFKIRGEIYFLRKLQSLGLEGKTDFTILRMVNYFLCEEYVKWQPFWLGLRVYHMWKKINPIVFFKDTKMWWLFSMYVWISVHIQICVMYTLIQCVCAYIKIV